MVILIVISFALEAFIIELYCRKSFTAKVRLDKRLIVYTVIYGIDCFIFGRGFFQKCTFGSDCGSIYYVFPV